MRDGNQVEPQRENGNMASNELSELAGIYSDVYKSLHGIRPRWVATKTVAWYEDALEKMQVEVEDDITRQAKEQVLAGEQFYKRMAEVKTLGAGDDVTALRWMVDGEDVEGDVDYFLYSNGVSTYSDMGKYIMKVARDNNIGRC